MIDFTIMNHERGGKPSGDQFRARMQAIHDEFMQRLEEKGIHMPENAPTPQDARVRWIKAYASPVTWPKRRLEAMQTIQTLSQHLAPISHLDTESLEAIDEGKREWVLRASSPVVMPGTAETATEIIRFLRTLQPKNQPETGQPEKQVDAEWLKTIAEREQKCIEIIASPFASAVRKQEAEKALALIKEYRTFDLPQHNT